ncbi:MAG: DUF4250 domain-containing protein [Eubacterium sp.]|jgi:hypothetical protein|nr:DUF4250 domain-containing protein [Eubacterium sp.]
MEHLPENPLMLYSVINTKLRDQYGSLQALCEDMGIDEKELTDRLKKEGFEYIRELNKFI